jgi:hypothetical protein
MRGGISRLARLVGRWLLAGALLAFTLGEARAVAQDFPVDVAGPGGVDLALPDAPEGYLREQRDHVRWEYPAQATSVARDLQEVFAAQWPRVVEELGGSTDGDLVIRVGRNPEEMRALAPIGQPPPAYASGVAYPARGLILLTLAAPETWERPDVASVLVHELSHVALHRAVNGNEVPRWFTEGVAIYQAHEQNLERTRTLWGGTVGGRLLPFEQLSEGFPSQAHRVNLAYAQSADFVRWLRARDDGDRKFREVIRRLRDGQAFQTALERTYSVTLTTLEEDWHAGLEERFQALPLLVGSGGLWVLAAFLIVIAYARRRGRDREKYQEWDREERDALIAAQSLLTSRLASHTTSGPSPTTPEDDNEVLYVVPAEPRFRDSSVPTVEHDGRSHTLH